MFSDNGYYKKSIYCYEKNESCANESISMKIHASQTLPLRTHTHLYVLQKAKVKSAMSPTSIFVEILRKSYRIFNKSVGLFMLKKHTRCLLKKEREYFDNRQMHTRGDVPLRIKIWLPARLFPSTRTRQEINNKRAFSWPRPLFLCNRVLITAVSLSALVMQTEFII